MFAQHRVLVEARPHTVAWAAMPSPRSLMSLTIPVLLAACTAKSTGSESTGAASKPKPEEVVCPAIAKSPRATIDLGEGAMRANGSYEVEVEVEGERESCSFTLTGVSPSTTECVGDECTAASPTTQTASTCASIGIGGTQDDGSVRFLAIGGTPHHIGLRLTHAGETLASGTATPDYTPDECGFIEPVVTLSGEFTPAASGSGLGSACPAEAALELDLAALTAKFRALEWTYGELPEWPDEAGAPSIADAPDYAPLLVELGMPALAAKVKLDPNSDPRDIYDCDLESIPLGADTLVRVDCGNLEYSGDGFGEDGTVLTSVLVLAGAATAKPCPLGGFTRESTLSGTPCLFEMPDGARQVELTTVELLAAGQPAVREDDYGGMCGAGTGRGDDVQVRFHAVVDGRFQELFAALISQGYYESPCFPESMIGGEVALIGAWPKQIQYTQAVSCVDAEEFMDSCDYDGKCVESKTTTIHSYVDGRYVPAPAK